MIGEAARSMSFNESLEYVLNLKTEDCNLTKAEREVKFPAVPVTEEAPAWEAGHRDRIIGGNMSGENDGELNQEFSAIRKLRPDIKNPLLCISIRKAPGDQVTADQWRDIAAETVDGLGFQGCPYLVVQHRDKDDHIHILASLIRLDGKVVSDSRSYQKIEGVMRDVELKYGLMPVKSSRGSVNRSPTWIERKRFIEAGEITAKMQLQQRITKVLESKPTTTQFINALRVEHGVKVFPRLDAGGLPRGVAFGLGDVAMSGTVIGNGYTWNRLLKRGLTFSEEDIEAVRRASEQAQMERQQSAGEESSFDEEINLAINYAAVIEVGADHRAALLELMSEIRVIEPERPTSSPQLSIADEMLRSSPQIKEDLAALPLPDSAVNSLPASQPVEKLESKPNVENPSVFSRDKDARIPSLRDTPSNAQKREGQLLAVNVGEDTISDVTNTVMRDTAMSPSPDATLTNPKDLQQQPQVPQESPSKIEREKGQPLLADISDETKTTNKPHDSVKSVASNTDEPVESERKNSQDKEPAQRVAGLKLQVKQQQHSEFRSAEIPPSIEKAKPTEAASAIPTTTESKSVKKKIEPTSPRPDPTSKSASHISVINKKDVATPTAEVKKAPRPAGADKPAKRQSILSSLRAVFDTAVKKHDPAVKKQYILEKYSGEREIARKSFGDDGSECMLRSQSTLDKHIVNAAQGVKRRVTTDYDVEHVLSRFHSIPYSIEGENWMDVGKQVAQAEKSTRVWANLGREVGVDAREEMRKEQSVVRKAAHSAYQAEHGFAPPQMVKQALDRTLDQLEQQPPSPNEISAVKQTDYRLLAKTPSFLPATRLQCLVSIIGRQRPGETHALNLIRYVEREVVQATPIQQLNVLKQIEPSLFSSAPKDNQSPITMPHENIIAWSREWHLEKTGKDINPEQYAVLLHTLRERASVKPSVEEMQAVKMVALKQGITTPPISNSLEARVKCAELVGTDRREQWGQLAVEIQYRLEAAKTVAREREAQETKLAAKAAARFKEALPNTPPTVERLTPVTIKQVIELSPQREKEITTKYAQPISFAEEQCRKAGDVPTLESRKALVAILAVHDVMKPTEQTLKAYNHLLEAKGEKLSLPLNELSALTKVNNIKGENQNFWLETGRAAIKIGATMRHVDELATAVAEAYRTEKNREIDPKVQLAIRKNLIAFADQPVGEKQTERVATIASELKVSPPDFDNSASASHWVMKHSPESHEMLANYAETIEARVTRQAKLNFQLDPANPQQQAGLLMAEWMMQTAHLAQLQSNQASPQFIEQNRIERQAQNAYLMAADRHEAHYGLEPHAILTEEQHAYLQEHKSSLDSYPHEALSSAIISDVSPANAPLGKEPEISYDESPSIDM